MDSKLSIRRRTLRTGHIGLNAYLHRFKLAPSPLCAHCAVPEWVPDFLLLCPAYRGHRFHIINRLGSARLSHRRLISSKLPSPALSSLSRDTPGFYPPR
ncbi:hypothetical protein B0H19DRAFT_965033 [Mycena capillaripes]|nr:hypothetical protein B0H19DRAFT_965033 [Mycena capillaripes]